jgi:hypothetical protein
MTHRAIDRRKFMAWTAMIVLAFAPAGIPTRQRIVVEELAEFAEMTERILHFPWWYMDHSRCFSLDSFDPTCPQCL